MLINMDQGTAAKKGLAEKKNCSMDVQGLHLFNDVTKGVRGQQDLNMAMNSGRLGKKGTERDQVPKFLRCRVERCRS